MRCRRVVARSENFGAEQIHSKQATKNDADRARVEAIVNSTSLCCHHTAVTLPVVTALRSTPTRHTSSDKQ